MTLFPRIKPAQATNIAASRQASSAGVGTPAATAYFESLLMPSVVNGDSFESIRRLMEPYATRLNQTAVPLPIPGFHPPRHPQMATSLPMIADPLLQYHLRAAASRNAALYENNPVAMNALFRPDLGFVIPNLRGNAVGANNRHERPLHWGHAASLVPPHPLQITPRILHPPSSGSASRTTATNSNGTTTANTPQHARSLPNAPPPSATRSKRSRRNDDNSSAARRLPETGIPLYTPEDQGKLNEIQIFLRQQVEFFRASEDDLLSYTRGKNKPIILQQVGLRCRHCSHIPVGRQIGRAHV